jgi:hypothetical protein
LTDPNQISHPSPASLEEQLPSVERDQVVLLEFLEFKKPAFFEIPRKSGEVVEKLIELATPYEPKHVAAALRDLTKASKIRRLKDSEGDWTYVNP